MSDEMRAKIGEAIRETICIMPRREFLAAGKTKENNNDIDDKRAGDLQLVE
jgi:hypothetical protein